jgi:hypothetical protein
MHVTNDPLITLHLGETNIDQDYPIIDGNSFMVINHNDGLVGCASTAKKNGTILLC